MNNKLLLSACILSVHVQASSEFVHTKKTGHEKSTKVKEDIVESLKRLLTWSSDMIASIAQEQRLIVQKVDQLVFSQGAFEQTNPQDLKQYRASLEKMERDFEEQARLIRVQFEQLKKDFKTF